jgi:hypothetical protein
MAKALDPAAATTKWVNNLSNASEAITAGVNAVTTAPGKAAAASVNVWLQRVQQSAQKWATKVGAVSLQSWQESMTTVGIPRIASGAQAKQGKYQTFATSFFPYLAQGQAKVAAMPKGTLANSIARATTMIQHNAAYAGRTS